MCSSCLQIFNVLQVKRVFQGLFAFALPLSWFIWALALVVLMLVYMVCKSSQTLCDNVHKSIPHAVFEHLSTGSEADST